ncbi:uncharacterized protein LOC8023508 isoform X2 [Ixodes scapularis]|nr:uncharacterized protein LOC8023508 isoform X2 [Ixodes scapularis]XP_029848597.2 uncharacterized protein LOC8023508 isoform X2 [Ixodes scapularis]
MSGCRTESRIPVAARRADGGPEALSVGPLSGSPKWARIKDRFEGPPGQGVDCGSEAHVARGTAMGEFKSAKMAARRLMNSHPRNDTHRAKPGCSPVRDRSIVGPSSALSGTVSRSDVTIAGRERRHPVSSEQTQCVVVNSPKARAIRPKGIAVLQSCGTGSEERLVTTDRVKLMNRPYLRSHSFSSKLPSGTLSVAESKNTEHSSSTSPAEDRLPGKPSENSCVTTRPSCAIPVTQTETDVTSPPSSADCALRECQAGTSKVASLAMSFENLLLGDTREGNQAHLQRGAFCNRSLPLETFQDAKATFRKRLNIPINGVVRKPCRIIGKSRRTPSPPGDRSSDLPRALVRRSSSLIGHTSYSRTRESVAESHASAVVERPSTSRLEATTDGGAAHPSWTSPSPSCEGNEKKLSAVQLAVLNLEARSQAALEKSGKLSFSSSYLESVKLKPAPSNSAVQELSSKRSVQRPPLPTARPATLPSSSSSSGTSPSVRDMLDVEDLEPFHSSHVSSAVLALYSNVVSTVHKEQPTNEDEQWSKRSAESAPATGAVRPNQSFLWTLQQTTRAPVNGSCDELSDAVMLPGKTRSSSALAGTGNYSSLWESIAGRPATNHVGASSKPETTTDGSSASNDNDGSKVDSCMQEGQHHWTHTLRGLASLPPDRAHEEMAWELVDTGDSSSSSTTYEHLYEPIYDVLEEEGRPPPDVVPDTDDVYAHQESESAGTSEPGLPGRNSRLTRSDIRLELSSHLNLVRLRKDVHSAAEIGVHLQQEPNKRGLVDCLLRPSSRKETATFYVRLSVDRQLLPEADGRPAKGIAQRSAPRRRGLRRTTSSALRRPRTPPPLPPIAAGVSRDASLSSATGSSSDSVSPPDFPAMLEKELSARLGLTHGGSEQPDSQMPEGEDVISPQGPFEEEPLYQFYQKCVAQESSSSEEEEETAQPRTRRSAMELLPCGTGQRSLWCEVPEVRASGLLERLSPAEVRLQEAQFEVLTSEASYARSLQVLVDHFANCPELAQPQVLHRREWDTLFGDVLPVREASQRLLGDLERRWEQSLVIEDVCDILLEHATKHLSVYVRYCSNQMHQDRLLKELRDTRPEWVEALERLERAPCCQGLSMSSFLLLPMQRITRLPLLVDAILRRLPEGSPKYRRCQEALTAINKIVLDCNDGARKMGRMQEMLHISRILEFKDCKAVPLISSSRWLVKRGELVKVTFDLHSKRTFGRTARYSKTPLHLFLFTDLLLITKKKGEDYFSVVDHCPRNLVQTTSLGEGMAVPARLPDCCRHLFQMTILQNHAGRMVEMLLTAGSESDKTRWMDVLTPVVSSDPEQRIYEEWDCPQVQCRHAYIPEQPDELALQESDVVNVFRKMSDGWYEGERIRDGMRGWFPSSHTVEVINAHVRSRNLRQRYRLLMASHCYLEQQQQRPAKAT